MAEQKYQVEASDQLISYSKYNEDTKGFDSAVVGQVVLPQNRNPRQSGKPYKTSKVSLNLNLIQELVKSGKLKTTKTGWVILDMGEPMSEEQKQKAKDRLAGKSTTPKEAPALTQPKSTSWGNAKPAVAQATPATAPAKSWGKAVTKEATEVKEKAWTPPTDVPF